MEDGKKSNSAEKEKKNKNMKKKKKKKKCHGPPYLNPLLQVTFFTDCKLHGESNNMYCLDCINGSLCSTRFIPDRGCRFIQV
ncbi:hypothetical protein EJ110_NYTH42223 [Nymphaea thermarum]|nr:hypothetical protein EJ110_NYTH42223 [Nymphaea thermarum]